MTDVFSYVIWDHKRKRSAREFYAFTDDHARREFSAFYNEAVRPSRWEARSFGRYYLFRDGVRRDGVLQCYERPYRLMDDDAVRLSYDHFRNCDPPANEAEEVELELEFDRLDGLDSARLARRGNQAA